MTKALIVEDDKRSREAMANLVELQGFQTIPVGTLKEAAEILKNDHPEVALVDLGLPDGSGLELLEMGGKVSQNNTRFIVVTGNGEIRTAVSAMNTGAYQYLTKPIDIDELKGLLANIHENGNGKAESIEEPERRRELSGWPVDQWVIASDCMRRISTMVDHVARTDACVLLTGESGTGKEIVARAVHERSPRRRKPFVPVNSGAISPNLIESMLFGHERGSFTGAHSTHHGYFELASGGTLFLDEITEMSSDLQIKLLRVLETRQVMRVGGTKLIDVDVRVIAATNRSPEEAVKKGKLREDLFYRLNVFPIHVPALRERTEEIASLSRHFLGLLNERYGTRVDLAEDALQEIQGLPWPGNVRQLRNVLERAHIMANGTITRQTIQELSGQISAVEQDSVFPTLVGMSIRQMEQRLIDATLAAYSGDKKRAAKTLGISLKTLYNRLKEREAKKARGAPAEGSAD